MFSKVSEKQMRILRWILVICWIILIVSLFYDPISSYLTKPDTQWSLLRLDPRYFDPERCAEVLTIQGKCVEEHPYPLGAKIFWGMLIPCAVMLLLVFGHEAWRRLCPLSFLSQIPRALGIQRQRKVVNPRTGKFRYELAKIAKDSWLGRNHLYFQFGLLCLGLTIRILFVNSNRLVLGSFLIFTILAAITVGYLFGGKSWCQYFCPMAPVQMVYNGPRSLLGSEAHQGQSQKITQSMCRTIDPERNEKSACVGCQSPCIDIDAERSYWEIQNKPGRKLVQYGYVGLVAGFYLYYFLYSGTLDYYYSGAWNHEENQLATLFAPGFYIDGQTIPIPKIIAAPLTLALFVGLSYFLFQRLEKAYKSYRIRINKPLEKQQIQHIIFSICTFVVFNIYFMFGGRPIIKLFPIPVELAFNALVVLVSTLWLYRTLSRSGETYSRESLASSLRRQLKKLAFDFSRFLEGRSIEDLKTDEVYVLAKVLPGFNREYSLLVYKGMLREALEQGNVDSANSLEVLSQIRQELDIKEEEHFTILTELGIEDPDLLDPQKKRTRESQLRLESYRQGLELQLLELIEMGIPLQQALQRKEKQIEALKREYGITAEEAAQVLEKMSEQNSAILRQGEALTAQLKEVTFRYKVLSNLVPNPKEAVFVALQLAMAQKQQIITKQLLSVLEILGDTPEALKIAKATSVFAENVLPDVMQPSKERLPWRERLSAEVFSLLQPSEEVTLAEALADSSPTPKVTDDEEPTLLRVAGQLTPKTESPERLHTVIEVLKELLQELDPVVEAMALHALNKLDVQQAREQARRIVQNPKPGDWLVRETAENILGEGEAQAAARVQTAIVRVEESGKIEERIFQQPVIRIGRSKINEIVLSDSKVASQHAILYLNDQGVSIIDLETLHRLHIGTKIVQNDHAILNQGDVIRFSPSPTPAITVWWEKRPVQSETSLEVMGTINKLLLLFDTSFFRSLTPDALIDLTREAEIHVYPQRTKLCQAGDPSDAILLLVEGSADVTILRDGTEEVVGRIHEGETIGEMGVLTRQLRSASVITTAEKNRVLVIKTESFEALLNQNPKLIRNLVLILSQRLQRLTTKLQRSKD
ncbi:MAG: cyclic nucleotide-binding domain-containing protein [Xenococcaceae cyanobacterium]